MHRVLDRLKRTKLVQWAIAYSAGAWLVLQVLGEIGEPWGLSAALQRGIQFELVVGFLATLVLAWFHGEKGRQTVGPVEGMLLVGLALTAVVGFSVAARFDPGIRGLDGLLGAEPYFALERDRPAIAVLPLSGTGAGPGDADFAEGIHQELINRLTGIPSLVVIARRVMRFADGRTGAREIGAQLAADYLLEGSARRTADRIRVTAQLVEARTEQPVWGESYDLEFTVENLIDIQIDVARRIAGALELELSPSVRAGLEERPTQILAAYESYLLGRVAWSRRTPASLEEAVAHLTRATELDPTFAEAYSALAEAYVLQPFFSADYASDVALARTEAVAERALALDPGLGEAHTALGLVREFRYDWERAEEEFRLAIAKSPEYATAHHWLANMLSRRGRPEEGLAHIQRAYELDPLSTIINQDVGYNLGLAGRLEAALRQYARTLALDPDYAGTTLIYAHALLEGGRVDEARASFERWAILSGADPVAIAELVDSFVAYRRSGQRQAPPPGLDLETTFSPYGLQRTYLALGDRERAIEVLRSAFDEGRFGITLDISGSHYDSLRDDPRFIAIARTIGLGLPSDR
ncbi:MAG: tetratricopeptide repeat protein [Longimicrobiales bacterium]